MKGGMLAKIPLILVLIIMACSEEFNPSELVIESNDSKSEADGDSNSDVSGSLVSYELTGDFSGRLDITFLSSENFTPPPPIIGATIPWQTNYNITRDVSKIGGFANGLYGDGKSGESAVLKMFLEDDLVETVIRTADENGMVNLPIESYDLTYHKIGTTISDGNIDKNVTYTINGNFSGELMIVYKVADGSQENIIVTNLPWQHTFKTIVYSYRASIYGLGNGGMEGEEITYSISIDDNIIESEEVVTNTEGHIGLYPEIVIDFE